MSLTFQALDADVIIIGAGVSGMTTAYTLLEKVPSLDILVLEELDRVGGRTLSVPSSSGVDDLGAQWISSQQTQLLDLLDRLNIQIEKKSDARNNVFIKYNKQVYTYPKKRVMDFFNPKDKYDLAAFVTKFEKLCRQPVLDENLLSKNLEEYINEHINSHAAKATIKWMILNYCGKEASKLTLGFYVFFCTSTLGIVNQLLDTDNGLHEFWIKNGAQEICIKITELLEHQITILTNMKVINIKQHNLQMEVQTNSGDTFFGSNVVITAPPSSILRINFFPSLSTSKISFLRNSTEGELIKFVVTYEKCFWKEKNLSGDIYVIEGYNKSKPLLRCYDLTEGNKPTLSGYALKNAKSLILKQLSEYFGEQALTPLNFRAKQWTGGSPMSCYNTYPNLSEMYSNEGRIYWAGAEMEDKWFGTIAGAVSAGNRVAKELLYYFLPAALSTNDLHFLL